MENFKSQINSMVTCSECGVNVHVDDAEASYNAELDDVFFYCSKCINNPDYLPAMGEEDFEAAEWGQDKLNSGVRENCDNFLQP